MFQINKFIATITFLTLLVLPLAALAQVAVYDCQRIGGVVVPSAFCNLGGTFSLFGLINICVGGAAAQSTASCVIITIINVLLAIAGILAVLFIVISGLRYITAHGNEEQAESAKRNLTHAVIGLAIVILSFVVVGVISNALIFGQG